MPRPRRNSAASEESAAAVRDQVCEPRYKVQTVEMALKERQELGSMYDYLAKIILLGPSGSGK